MKNKKKELSLAVETITHLNQDEMKVIKGGFLSFGDICSLKTKCPRLYTKCWGGTRGELPGERCVEEDVLNSG